MKNQFIIIYPPSDYSFIDLKDFAPKKFIPFGGLFLAESLMNHGYSVSIIDGTAVDEMIKRIESIVTDDVVALGLSSMSGSQLKNSLKMASYFKTNYPQIPVIWGGAHVTGMPIQSLESDLVDYIVFGEGEISIVALLNSINGKGEVTDINGVGYKSDDKPVINESIGYTDISGRVFNLPYNLLNMNDYSRKLNIGMDRNFAILTSRGCPYKCRFCNNTSKIWPNNRVRYHLNEHIISDISTLVNKYDADGITINDDVFFVDEKKIIKICDELKKADFKVKYRALSRADLLCRLSEKTLELLQETGFNAISIGIESGSQKVLDFIGKGITLEQIYKADEILTKRGFFKTYTIMSYLPGETIDDVKKTLELVIKLAKTSLYCPFPFGGISKYTPRPGTELYDESVKMGFREPENIYEWTEFDGRYYAETKENVRPWLTDELYDYMSSANDLLVKLSNLFTGKDADQSKIAGVINEIEAFIC